MVTLTLRNLIFNPNWNLYELNPRTSIQISNYNCNIVYITSEENFLKLFCNSYTLGPDQTNYITTIPSFYLRDQATRSLLNIVIVPDINTPSAYVVDRWMTADAYYYQGDSILHVIYTVQIEASWKDKLSNINIGININGFNVPKSWIKLVSDPNNYVAAEVQWFDLVNTDIVDLQFNSYWALDTPEGYHNQWFRSAPSNIYFLPDNSPSNTTNTVNTTTGYSTNTNSSNSTNTTNTNTTNTTTMPI